jgi:vitamin B12 transporter
VWDATGQYTFGDSWHLRANVGTAFRLPTAEELFANDPADERGDPNLLPERSFNGNVAVGGHAGFAGLPGVAWEAIGFYRDVTDLISASGFDTTTMQSLFENIRGTVKVRGATLVLDVQLPTSWSGNASYTYSSAEQTNGLQIDRIPRQQAKAWVDWHPTDLPMGAMVVANYVGDVYQSFGDTDRERYGGYVIVDLGGRVFLDEERHHKINLTLSNFLGTTYAASLGKGVSDADGSSYTYWNLGAPRALTARYTYKF